VALIIATRMCLAQETPPPSLAPVADAGTIIDLEDAAWQAYKNKQPRSFRKLFYRTYCGVYAKGIKTLDMEVADMEKTDIDSYSLADIKVDFPNPSIAVITYKATQQTTSEGKDVSGTYYNESVWVKKGEKWLNAFHTEIKSK
jgi:Domain of unknown function (DUF4440)